MEKIIKLKPGETIISLFKNLEVGDIIHIKDPRRFKYASARNEAVRKNKEARLIKEIKEHEFKYSVLVTLKEGYTSIVYNDLSKK